MRSSRDIWVRRLPSDERDRAKRSFATRRVPPEVMATVVGGKIRPRSGDVVLSRVHKLGQHRRIEQPNGRRSVLHLDDTIIVSYADRYATDQFESHVPRTLARTQLVASGGIASKVLSRSGLVKGATDIVPIGLIGDERGRPLNVADFALDVIDPPAARPRTVCVMGTAMNSGKTTTIHYLVHGLAKYGLKPGVTKVTGTGSGNDFWVMLDSGAHRMLDFTDAGLASTFRQPLPVLEHVMTNLVSHLTASGTGINFVEIADGVFQGQNIEILRSQTFHDLIDCVVFAASDAMGAAYGVQALRELGINVVAVAGALTRSPLATREAQQHIGIPVLTLEDLQDPAVMAPILGLDPATIGPKRADALPAWPLEWESLYEEIEYGERGASHLLGSNEFAGAHDELSLTTQER